MRRTEVNCEHSGLVMFDGLNADATGHTCVLPALELRQKVNGEHMPNNTSHQEVRRLALKGSVELVNCERSSVSCGLHARICYQQRVN
jgi:hypothetical protein